MRRGTGWNDLAMFALLACGLGFYVGLQFRILALLPFALIGGAAYALTFWFAGLTPAHSVAELLAPLVTMQLGYFIGLTARENYRYLILRLKTGQPWRT